MIDFFSDGDKIETGIKGLYLKTEGTCGISLNNNCGGDDYKCCIFDYDNTPSIIKLLRIINKMWENRDMKCKDEPKNTVSVKEKMSPCNCGGGVWVKLSSAYINNDQETSVLLRCNNCGPLSNFIAIGKHE